MQDSNDVILDKLVMPCKCDYIYASYLSPSSGNFKYKGYEDLSQIGKYFTLTIGDKKTRLYTMVNFLNQANISLMSRITGTKYV